MALSGFVLNPRSVSTPAIPQRLRSTLGSLLRKFTFGHVHQLYAVAWLHPGNPGNPAGLARSLTANTNTGTPNQAGTGATDAGTGGYVFVDVDDDDTIIEVHGHQKQGTGCGHSGRALVQAMLDSQGISRVTTISLSTGLLHDSTDTSFRRRHTERATSSRAASSVAIVPASRPTGSAHLPGCALIRFRGAFSISSSANPQSPSTMSLIDYRHLLRASNALEALVDHGVLRTESSQQRNCSCLSTDVITALPGFVQVFAGRR